jgi:uncharacterized RDD family membrane protein YckC
MNNNVVDLKKYLAKKVETNKLVQPQAWPIQLEDVSTKRALAFGIDVMIIGFIKIVFSLSYTHYLNSFFYNLNVFQQIEAVNQMRLLDISFTAFCFISYFTLTHYLMEGKTVGKKIMKLVAVNNNYLSLKNNWDNQLSLAQCFLRTSGYLAAYFTLGVLFCLPFLRKDKKSLSELFSSSTVISTSDFHRIFLAKSESNNVIEIDLEQIKAA